MLTVDSIERGVVLDHIKAGNAMKIYQYLGLDELDCSIAIIKNVKSDRLGKKDIMKIEGPIDLDLDVLGFVDPNITVNLIDHGAVISKANITTPERITNIIRCKNPRCITSAETSLPHIFTLADPKKRVYRCHYCEQAAEHR